MIIDRDLSATMFPPTRTLTYNIARVSIQHRMLQRELTRHNVNVLAEVRQSADHEWLDVIETIYIGKRRFALATTKERRIVKTATLLPARWVDHLLLALPTWFHRFVKYTEQEVVGTAVVPVERAEYYYVDPEIQMTRDGHATICRIAGSREDAAYERAKADADFANAVGNPTGYIWR